MLAMKIMKWGNSSGIRIPVAILDQLRLNQGDDVRMEVQSGRLVITPVKKRKTLAERFAEYSGPSYEELFGDEMRDWEQMPPVGNEML